MIHLDEKLRVRFKRSSTSQLDRNPNGKCSLQIMMTLLSGILTLTLLATSVGINDVAVSNESPRSVLAVETLQSEKRDPITNQVSGADNREVEQILASPLEPFLSVKNEEKTTLECVNFQEEKDPRVKALLKDKAKDREEAVEKFKDEERKRNDKTGFDIIYQDAGQKYSIPWEILSAIHLVETGRRGNTGISSYAGATGPMQFMPSTFRRYGVDGDGDGRAIIHDSDDAIYSAANYLRASGGNSNIRGALYHYNHSTAYVNKVVGIARSIGYHG